MNTFYFDTLMEVDRQYGSEVHRLLDVYCTSHVAVAPYSVEVDATWRKARDNKLTQSLSIIEKYGADKWLALEGL